MNSNYQLKKHSIKKYHTKHKERLRKYNEERLQRLKAEAYIILGNKCISCGFTDKRALQIDHINGGGSKERREKPLHGTMKYKRIIENPTYYKDILQILCANCNWIKKFENYEKRT